MKSSALARLILVQIVANVEGFHNFLAPSARGFALHATSDGQTVPMLKEKCRALGLKVSGTKAELIERLNSGSSSPSNPTAAAPPRAQPAEGGAPREKVASTPAVISDALADVLPAAAPKLSEALKPPRASPAKRKGGKVVLSDADLLPENSPAVEMPVYREPPAFVSSRSRGGDRGRGGSEREPSGSFSSGGRRNERSGGGGRDDFKPRQDFGPTGHDYERCADDASGDLAAAGGVEKVDALLAARLTAKLSRDFQTADAIRDELRDLGVIMHDGTKMWRGDGVDAFQSSNGGGDRGGGRTFSAARGSGEGLRQDGSQDPSGYVYTRAGLQPADGGIELDEVKVHELIDVRGQFKMTGRFEEADAVRDQLLAMGVELNDRARKWVALQPGGHPYAPLRGPLTSAIDPADKAEVDQLLATRFHAKRSRNFDAADDAQEALRALGVEVDDQNYSWRFNQGNASF